MAQQLYPQYFGYGGNNTKEYINELLTERETEKRIREANSCILNPIDGYIYLETKSDRPQKEYSRDVQIPWDKYPKVSDSARYRELIERKEQGKRHANDDQVEYGHYTNEFVNEAVKAHSAGVITSTEFPSITVTTIQNELLRNELLVAQKYNLLQITETRNVDQLWVVYPEYDDTTKAVRTGYKEGDPIWTTGWGAFTETRIGLEKSGAGIGFTEEYYMRQFTYPIQSFIMDHIAQDFARVKHERLVTLLDSFSNVAGADWGAYTAGNLQSTNRPTTNFNTVKVAINADKRAFANTVVSRENVFIDYMTNTWIKGIMQPLTASTTSQNETVTNPVGLPFVDRWILNEDVTDNVAYVFDNRAFLMLQGPRITTQFQNHNPEETMFIQKDWFKQHLRKPTWGRELTGISV